MRMPFTEFITGGDLKFMIALTLLAILVIAQFIKKVKANRAKESDSMAIEGINLKMDKVIFWIPVLSLFSFLLGLLHSFYFISKIGGAAPALIFQGIAFTLVTPVYGLVIFMLCKIMKGLFNAKAHSTSKDN